VLVDKRASKANILHRLRVMVDESKAGDYLVFHFSGHGSQIRDRDGDELRDNMDELICPWDMNWDDGFITDDTLYEIFSQLGKNVMLEVVLDCCHSGTGLRDIGLGRPPELGPENPTVPRFLPPPMDITCRSEGEEDELKLTRRLFQKKNKPSNQVLWSGCMAHQTSADAFIKGSYNGAFTFYFCDHLRKSGARLSRRQLLNRVRNSLRHNQYTQIPQLDTAANIKKIRALSVKEKP
jgi:hypothetical protein